MIWSLEVFYIFLLDNYFSCDIIQTEIRDGVKLAFACYPSNRKFVFLKGTIKWLLHG